MQPISPKCNYTENIPVRIKEWIKKKELNKPLHAITFSKTSNFWNPLLGLVSYMYRQEWSKYCLMFQQPPSKEYNKALIWSMYLLSHSDVQKINNIVFLVSSLVLFHCTQWIVREKNALRVIFLSSNSPPFNYSR